MKNFLFGYAVALIASIFSSHPAFAGDACILPSKVEFHGVDRCILKGERICSNQTYQLALGTEYAKATGRIGYPRLEGAVDSRRILELFDVQDDGETRDGHKRIKAVLKTPLTFEVGPLNTRIQTGTRCRYRELLEDFEPCEGYDKVHWKLASIKLTPQSDQSAANIYIWNFSSVSVSVADEDQLRDSEVFEETVVDRFMEICK